MAQLKVLALGFEEMGNKSINDLEKQSIQIMYDILRNEIGSEVSKGSQIGEKSNSLDGVFLHALINKHGEFIEVNTKDCFTKMTNFERMKQIFEIYHRDEVEGTNRPNALMGRDWAEFFNFMKSNDYDVAASNVFRGEFPFVKLYVARIGNKDYSFFTITR